LVFEFFSRLPERPRVENHGDRKVIGEVVAGGATSHDYELLFMMAALTYICRSTQSAMVLTTILYMKSYLDIFFPVATHGYCASKY
jgi:hypothetical protein